MTENLRQESQGEGVPPSTLFPSLTLPGTPKGVITLFYRWGRGLESQQTGKERDIRSQVLVTRKTVFLSYTLPTESQGQSLPWLLWLRYSALFLFWSPQDGLELTI